MQTQKVEKQEAVSKDSINNVPTGNSSSSVSDQPDSLVIPNETKNPKSNSETIDGQKTQVTNLTPSSNGPSSTKNENMESVLHEKIKELEHFTVFEEKEEKRIAKQAKTKLKEAKEFIEDILENSTLPVEEQSKQIISKFAVLVQEIKTTEKEILLKNKKLEQLVKEKETLHTELNKANTMKVKLENLCRELQKQNKTAIEESKRASDEEKQRRQELSKKFHEKIQEISQKLEEQGDERMKFFRENEMLREKLKNFAEQYEIRERHFETTVKAKDLELQLSEAKVKQQTHLAAQEAFKAKTQATAYEEQILTAQKTEKELRTQLTLYAQKFEQFQDTLNKSNDVFNTFKQDMDRMSKTIKRNEKENGELKKKCEQSDLALIDLAEERNNYKNQLETVKVQKKKLEDLCRTLQAERIQLRSELNKLEEQSNVNQQQQQSDSRASTDSISDSSKSQIGNKQPNSTNGNGVVNNTTILDNSHSQK